LEVYDPASFNDHKNIVIIVVIVIIVIIIISMLENLCVRGMSGADAAGGPSPDAQLEALLE
jgi:hypothetical protein